MVASAEADVCKALLQCTEDRAVQRGLHKHTDQLLARGLVRGLTHDFHASIKV